MLKDSNSESFLGPYRVLDLTTEYGFIGGKLMGDLGADVIKIEPPGGDQARNLGPFFQGQKDPEKSLYWTSFNLNKRGVTLNLETHEGQKLFKRLVESADFILESQELGYLDSLGIGYESLSKINPRIIMSSITPFGQSGPYKDFKSSDLISMAMGGYLFTTGDPDRPPVRISFPVSYCHAGSEAAAAAMMAHWYRERTGEGQHIDISMQECITWTLMNTTAHWNIGQNNISRGGSIRTNPTTGVATKGMWPTKDGYVTFNIAGGPARADGMRYLVNWMDEYGMASDFIKELKWEDLFIPDMTQEIYDGIARDIGPFLLTQTTNDLYKRAVIGKILLAPITTPPISLESPQLIDRESFVEIDYPEFGRKITYPGPFVKMSSWAPVISRKAPLIGEHNKEIYCTELGISAKEFIELEKNGVI
jgi:crotonobetainyl-CoA:carnitine CoA-transferase CaiB-like acyl-CoA transferase